MLSKMADGMVDCLVVVLMTPCSHKRCDISISTRRKNVFVLFVVMFMLTSQVLSLVYACAYAFVLVKTRL